MPRGYFHQYWTPRWWEHVPEEWREYEWLPSLHFAVSVVLIGFLCTVQPQTPVVW